MQNKRLTFLFRKAITQQATEEERNELFFLMDDNVNKQQTEKLFEEMRSEWSTREEFFSQGESHDLEQEIMTKIRRKKIHPLKSVLFKRWSFAAAIVIFLGFVFYFYQNVEINNNEQYSKLTKEVIVPGKDKATLTLGNGDIINLDDISSNQSIEQNGITINKTKDGELFYEINNPSAIKEDEVRMNVLATPRGGQFRIVLPDGTKVWLNAESQLNFPSRFIGNERNVTLQGEAYFEVAKDKVHPFLLTANGTEVKVLGTHFSVSAYDDEEVVKTTLVEGSVSVGPKQSSIFSSNSFKEEHAVLKPGQQAITNNKTNRINVRKIEIEDALAWKNGYFVFQNDDIKTVMQTIARWYDINVIYKGDLSKETFIGTISKFESIEKLLQTVELTGGVHFNIERRNIIVMK